ncbi:MAG: substrate-binding domain-containing protein [Spirosomataceae bacterium]
MKSSLWSIIGFGLCLFACGTGGPQTNIGKINVSADESLQPLMQAEEAAFEGLIKNVEVNLFYRPEDVSIGLMINDSTRIAVVTRELNPKEQEVVRQNKQQVYTHHLATDAVALISHPSNRDTLMTMNEVKAIFSGQTTNWSVLKGANLNEKIVLVFDNNNSSNLSFMCQKLGITDKTKVPFFTAKSNEGVIEYVKKTPGALGVIGINWISDTDDPAAEKFIAGINVLGLTDSNSPDSEEDYAYPIPFDLRLGRYPLKREIYLLTKDTRNSFLNYACKDKGQLVVLKAGLLPATPPERQIHVNNKMPE